MRRGLQLTSDLGIMRHGMQAPKLILSLGKEPGWTYSEAASSHVREMGGQFCVHARRCSVLHTVISGSELYLVAFKCRSVSLLTVASLRS